MTILFILLAKLLNAQECTTTQNAYVSFVNTCSGKSYSSAAEIDATAIASVSTGFYTGQDIACSSACQDAAAAASSAATDNECGNPAELALYSAYIMGLRANIITSCVKTANNLDYCVKYQIGVDPSSTDYICTDCYQRQVEALIDVFAEGSVVSQQMKNTFDSLCANVEIKVIEGSGASSASSMFNYFGVIVSLLMVL